MTPTPGELNLSINLGVTFDGAQFIVYDEEDLPKDLTDWTAQAEVRKKAQAAVVLDLLPTITDGPAGEVTIPAIADEDTADLTPGGYYWDFILINAAGERHGPYLAGQFTISRVISQPA